jgi:hypothetical protein
MHTGVGQITEILLDGTARLSCPKNMVPAAGQYLLAYSSAWSDTLLPMPLFRAGIDPRLGQPVEAGRQVGRPQVAAQPRLPEAWTPGTLLSLRGALGHGFRLPGGVQRLALAAVRVGAARLLPLAEQALAGGAAVALFGDGEWPWLPLALEAHPLSALAEARSWPDFLALDLTLETLADLRGLLGLAAGEPLGVPAQALIATTMVCGGMAGCGICGVPLRNGGEAQACQDGPVFELEKLDW